jgi:hypothetical protein
MAGSHSRSMKLLARARNTNRIALVQYYHPRTYLICLAQSGKHSVFCIQSTLTQTYLVIWQIVFWSSQLSSLVSVMSTYSLPYTCGMFVHAPRSTREGSSALTPSMIWRSACLRLSPCISGTLQLTGETCQARSQHHHSLGSRPTFCQRDSIRASALCCNSRAGRPVGGQHPSRHL